MANPSIQFGTYVPDESTRVEAKLTLGIFFDGTLNNRRNTYIRKEKEKKRQGKTYDKEAVDEDPRGWDKDSYENDYSNVARMADYYSEGKGTAVYVEGPGTEDGKTDTLAGYLTGTGETGVPMKVRSACEKIAKKVPKGSTLVLTLDVFGFSRGAAGARRFLYEITKFSYLARVVNINGNVTYWDSFNKEVNLKRLPGYGHLGYLLANKQVKIEYLVIRFVGLYDTVSSYGVNFDDDVEDLKLDSVSHNSVKNVVQLAASDEWRKNFSLTNINSAGNKGRQYLIPGAHADVGGCYESETYEQTHKVGGINEAAKREAALEKASLVQKGWYKENELKEETKRKGRIMYYKLRGKRYIDKKYSYIPLHLMCQLALEKKVMFDIGMMGEDYSIPSKTSTGKPHILGYVKEKLKAYVEAVKKATPEKGSTIRYQDYLDFENEKILRNGYIHWSATGKTGHEPRDENKRKIISG